MSFLRKKVRSKKTREDMRHAFFETLFLTIGLVCAVLVLATQITRLPQVTLSDVKIVGAKTVSTDELESLVWEQLSGSYGFFLFPRVFSLIIPRNTIEETLLVEQLRLREIALDLGDMQTLVVTVSERTPVAVWCEDESTPICFFVDANGFMYAPAPEFTGNAFFKIIGSNSVRTPVLGDYILGTEAFSRMYAFIKSMEDLSIESAYAIVYKEYFTIGMVEGGQLYVAYADDYREQFDTVREALMSDVLQTSDGGRRRDIEYIDVRFGNRVFFKENTQENVEEIETAEN